jgi:hypothetical protein
MELSKIKVKNIARKYGWNFVCYQGNIGMISFCKSFLGIQKKEKRISLDVILGYSHERKTDCRINIYLTKGTVATALNHPKKGKTQLYRKNITYKQLEELFINPRQHTGKGYYQKYE